MPCKFASHHNISIQINDFSLVYEKSTTWATCACKFHTPVKKLECNFLTFTFQFPSLLFCCVEIIQIDYSILAASGFSLIIIVYVLWTGVFTMNASFIVSVRGEVDLRIYSS